MRDPPRKALYCLLALLAGAGLVAFGAAREARIGEDWTAIAPIVVGLGILPFALVTFIQALFAWRGRTLLLRGEDVIARWQVFPGEWEQFRRLDGQRAAEEPSLANDMRIRKAVPDAPIEVIVGRKSLLVDGSYHSLRPGGLPEFRGVGWLEGPPACLEFSLAYPRGRYGGVTRFTLRVPVPAGARAAARQVFAHFEPLTHRRPGLALRHPPSTYKACAFLFAVASLAGGTGTLLARNIPDGGDPIVPLALIIGALGLGAFASVLAMATLLLTWRR